jgi:hypothetical protein
MTITGRDVDDGFFARLRAVFDDDALIELTATIACENASSRFNRALRVPSQDLWRRTSEPPGGALPGTSEGGSASRGLAASGLPRPRG